MRCNMNELSRVGQAGTLESNDIMITIAPLALGKGITIELNSPVIKQYGTHIKQLISELLETLAVKNAAVIANDKGALDCTIKARLITAVERAKKGED